MLFTTPFWHVPFLGWNDSPTTFRRIHTKYIFSRTVEIITVILSVQLNWMALVQCWAVAVAFSAVLLMLKAKIWLANLMVDKNWQPHTHTHKGTNAAYSNCFRIHILPARKLNVSLKTNGINELMPFAAAVIAVKLISRYNSLTLLRFRQIVCIFGEF